MKGMVLLLMVMMLFLWVVRSGGILLRWPYGHFSKVRSMTFRARQDCRTVLYLCFYLSGRDACQNCGTYPKLLASARVRDDRKEYGRG